MSYAGFRFRLAVAAAGCTLLVAPLSAQRKLLTIDDVYDPQKRIDVSVTPASDFVWVDETHYMWPRKAANDSVDWTLADAVSGTTTPLFDAAKMEAAVGKLPGVGADDARRVAHSRSLTFNDQQSAAMFTIGGDLYAYSFGNDRAVRLTYAPGEEEAASFSPDGSLVAFVRANNLFVVDVAMRRESQITTDGSAKVHNGRLDWVYEEEIYGRGQKGAYWWSPDSTRIAYLRLDDTPVPSFPIVDQIPYEQGVEELQYPKAGDPNPTATLGIVRVTGGATSWIDLTKYPAEDRLVVAVAWMPDSKSVTYQVQNRIQTWLDLNVGSIDGATRTVFRETSKAWVAPNNPEGPRWLEDGGFLWLSEQTGWEHLFRYKADGTLVKQITDGKWEIRTLHGVDGSQGWIYFSAIEHSPIAEDAYRIRLDGTGLERLTRAEGTHSAVFSPRFAYYIDSWSDAATPPEVRLHRRDGSQLRVVEAGHGAALAAFQLATPEFLHVKTRDGFVMEAEMIKPPDFNPSRRYPVYQFTYGGPHAPQVRNAWGGAQYLYHQMLAQNGVIVWICDNRTASGKGLESTGAVFHNFGELELRDIEDGIAWLKKQPYVDASRIGLHGWSYGGYMTSYALTHSNSFAMGIAGGSVTDWRDYDSVYTERYMGLPSDNPDGYHRSSPRWSAADLKAPLLLIHGAIDDNVHAASSIQFAYELQKAQKPFELMLYPKSRHGIADPVLVKHLRQTMLDYTLKHLKPGS